MKILCYSTGKFHLEWQGYSSLEIVNPLYSFSRCPYSLVSLQVLKDQFTLKFHCRRILQLFHEAVAHVRHFGSRSRWWWCCSRHSRHLGCLSKVCSRWTRTCHALEYCWLLGCLRWLDPQGLNLHLGCLSTVLLHHHTPYLIQAMASNYSAVSVLHDVRSHHPERTHFPTSWTSQYPTRGAQLKSHAQDFHLSFAGCGSLSEMAALVQW